MLKQPDLANLKKGDMVDHYLMIRKIEERSTKAGKAFLSLELGDKSSGINANVWNDTSGFEQLSGKVKTGDIVKVSGTIDEFQGSPQIKINSAELVGDTAGITASDFLSKSLHDPEAMENEFLTRIEQISNLNLKTLLKNIFSGEELEKFKMAPAGKSWHHAYLSGLIEHTLELIKICDLMCDFHKELNKDLLIAGAMLHDFASPVVPKIPEAIALYQADELSAKVNAYLNTLKTEVSGEGNWTKFIHLAQTDLYRQQGSSTNEDNVNKSLFD
ncbi:MAG: OB-fold nucleic acid binding domain-containing protein [Ignavibacteriaceae bacterium]